jgi:hypothetical protein
MSIHDEQIDGYQKDESLWAAQPRDEFIHPFCKMSPLIRPSPFFPPPFGVKWGKYRKQDDCSNDSFDQTGGFTDF